MGGTCSCQCHTGPYAACDTPGGCGNTGDGCGTDPAGACQLCRLYRPNTRARIPHRPPVCDGDRQLLGRHVGDIANLIADLTNDEPAVVDDRRYQRIGVEYLKDGNRRAVSLGDVWADPTAAFGGVAPINSRSKEPAVTGSRERPIPINTTALDLKAPARVPNHTPAVADWPEDQTGHLSAATILDAWIRDTRDRLLPDHHLPPGTVDEMVAWLKHRIDLICDQHPQVADFADSIRTLRGALRSLAGETEAQPERCEGVPCRRCDLQMLYRQPGGDVECVNPDCRAILRDDEYQEWVKSLAAEIRVKQRQHT
jgi:hypothetical protein